MWRPSTAHRWVGSKPVHPVPGSQASSQAWLACSPSDALPAAETDEVHQIVDQLLGRFVEAAVAALLSDGKTLTYDLIGEAKASRCSEVGAAVEEKLRTMA